MMTMRFRPLAADSRGLEADILGALKQPNKNILINQSQCELCAGNSFAFGCLAAV
jgi:hypothetical protein